MRIPPFWARESHTELDHEGNKDEFQAWGWSFENLHEAKQQALDRVRRIADLVKNGQTPDTYDYLDRPLREEIVESIHPNGEEIALITRNRYGSLILNTASVCFVDVDFPYVSAPGLLKTIANLFSRNKREKNHEISEATLQKVKQWYVRNPNRSFRLYRTLAGLRLLFTDRLYDPLAEETAALMQELGSDRLYRRLTEKQECFRARLTPKPWRCGFYRPPNNKYPWDNPNDEQAYRNWQSKYETKCQGYKTCQLLETFGPNPTDDHINTIITIHDQYSCDESTNQLA